MNETTQSFEEWAILELMGHRRLAGKVTEQNIGGAPFIRIDVPASKDRKAFTQFYSGPSIYCITPSTEEICVQMAQTSEGPIHRFDLAALPDNSGGEFGDFDEDVP